MAWSRHRRGLDQWGNVSHRCCTSSSPGVAGAACRALLAALVWSAVLLLAGFPDCIAVTTGCLGSEMHRAVDPDNGGGDEVAVESTEVAAGRHHHDDEVTIGDAGERVC